jgi:hypothetical protein
MPGGNPARTSLRFRRATPRFEQVVCAISASRASLSRNGLAQLGPARSVAFTWSRQPELTESRHEGSS